MTVMLFHLIPWFHDSIFLFFNIYILPCFHNSIIEWFQNPCFHSSIVTCFHASMIPASMLPLPQITTTNNYWSRKQKLWQDSICKDVIPCHSMLSCFHASMLPCFHASMLQYFHDSMIPASLLSGLHVRQVRHVRISISTNFKKCDSLTQWLTHRHDHLYRCYRI